MVETLTTAIFDTFKSLRSKKPLVVSLMCFILFLCGLTMCLQGGIYMFELFNSYSAGLAVVILAITEVIAVQYVYGFKNLMNAITKEIGIWIPAPLYYYWTATWLFITPVSLAVSFNPMKLVWQIIFNVPGCLKLIIIFFPGYFRVLIGVLESSWIWWLRFSTKNSIFGMVDVLLFGYPDTHLCTVSSLQISENQ